MLKTKTILKTKTKSYFLLLIALLMVGIPISCNKDDEPAPVPTIESFTPTSGVARDIVTITGTNLEDADVSFNGTAATVISSSDESLQARGLLR